MTLTFAVSAGKGKEATPRRRGPGVRGTLTGWAFAGPATLVVVGLSLFPAVWAFFISRTKWNGIAEPENIGWRNYERLAQDPDLAAAAQHTLLLTALFVPSSIAAGMVIATALNQKIRLIGFYRTCIFVPYVASAASTGILAGYVFNPQFGGVNEVLRRVGLPPQQFLEDPAQAMIVVCVIALWGEVGFTSVVYLAALQDVPRELIEAATVDGASRWRIFRSVTLPQLRPVTLFASVWQTITALQLFDLIYTTTRGGPMNSTQTIVYYVYELAFQTRRLGYGAAVAYLLFAVTLLLTALVIWRSRRSGEEAF
ncbi:carbohydrate ABC transporter permease [Dactylosporangium sucinum]|uniref:ABC transporter permease n=1 Tax=Dactylosporangium sucinum TaxID=1424081 RepID=A0A917T997_9ACTN|nr:sugar ABC transporter permease [Dactylosporangium sucinum]GGM15190.1 ABC transporter permease [Dactylosporangium sucinum]